MGGRIGGVDVLGLDVRAGRNPFLGLETFIYNNRLDYSFLLSFWGGEGGRIASWLDSRHAGSKVLIRTGIEKKKSMDGWMEWLRMWIWKYQGLITLSIEWMGWDRMGYIGL